MTTHLEEKTAPSTIELLIAAEERTELYKLLSRALNIRERRIISLRYGLYGPERTLRDIGEILGVGGERVRQIENKAIEKLYRGYKGGGGV